MHSMLQASLQLRGSPLEIKDLFWSVWSGNKLLLTATPSVTGQKSALIHGIIQVFPTEASPDLSAKQLLYLADDLSYTRLDLTPNQDVGLLRLLDDPGSLNSGSQIP